VEGATPTWNAAAAFDLGIPTKAYPPAMIRIDATPGAMRTDAP